MIFQLESLKKNLRSLDKMHTLVNDAIYSTYSAYLHAECVLVCAYASIHICTRDSLEGSVTLTNSWPRFVASINGSTVVWMTFMPLPLTTPCREIAFAPSFLPIFLFHLFCNRAMLDLRATKLIEFQRKINFNRPLSRTLKRYPRSSSFQKI